MSILNTGDSLGSPIIGGAGADPSSLFGASSILLINKGRIYRFIRFIFFTWMLFVFPPRA
jgi:hypothetical protein